MLLGSGEQSNDNSFRLSTEHSHYLAKRLNKTNQSRANGEQFHRRVSGPAARLSSPNWGRMAQPALQPRFRYSTQCFLTLLILDLYSSFKDFITH